MVGLSLPIHPCTVFARSESSDETAQVCAGSSAYSLLVDAKRTEINIVRLPKIVESVNLINIFKLISKFGCCLTLSLVSWVRFGT